MFVYLNLIQWKEKAFFFNLKIHICLVNPGGFKTSDIQTSFDLKTTQDQVGFYIALLEEVEPWEAVDTKGENHGITCILSQMRKIGGG